jgi:2-polyprenyl-3-methyl-5-hydroxy-6-metoxy-1,4-benzoquinol methylase
MKFNLARMAKKRLIAIQKYLQKGNLLEIGPGTGEFILESQKAGFHIEAIEYSETLVAYLRSICASTIHNSSLESYKHYGEQVDGVISFHVLEHVMNPKEHLIKIYKFTKSRGYLILATPNAAGWDRMISKCKWTGYSPGHMNLFTPLSLASCIEKAGFKIVKVLTYQHALALIWTIKSLLKRGETEKINDYHAGKIISKIPLHIGVGFLFLFGIITKPIRLFQELFEGGNEIFIIAQKLT